YHPRPVLRLFKNWGNGHAETCGDPLMAVMCYRSTPCTTTGFIPAELIVGRKIRTTLPTLEKNLQPKWPNKGEVKRRHASWKAKVTLCSSFFNLKSVCSICKSG
uniref:Uncharacterized protein n=1 Tax=Oreochromis niloticus TaxID=8128 RepID=A0A669CFB8_ORENI